MRPLPHPSARPRPAAALLALLSVALVASGTSSCAGVATYRSYTADPVVEVHGPAPGELGVSTEYGVVFLGRTVRSGRVEFSAWFGDGPSREEGVVEPLGGGLYATRSEIVLPTCPITFAPPPDGTVVRVRGRRSGEPFEIEARLARDERVRGLLLEPNRNLDRLRDSQIGAGIFVAEPGKVPRLLGLVSGRLVMPDGREYVTAVGPEDLWRAVVHRRNSDRPRQRVYRDDID
jgi:hypothetical protein